VDRSDKNTYVLVYWKSQNSLCVYKEIFEDPEEEKKESDENQEEKSSSLDEPSEMPALLSALQG